MLFIKFDANINLYFHRRNRFTIPPPRAFDSPIIHQQPISLVFRAGEIFNSANPQRGFVFPPSAQPSPGNTTLYFPSSLPPSGSRPDSSAPDPCQPSTSEQTQSSSKKKKWTDQETRYLIDISQDNFPISKRKNAAVWEAIAKTLNKKLKDEGLTTFRSGSQCKTRMNS